MQLARLPDDGVPRAGVTREGLFKVGLEDNTTEPEPVDEVTPVPPLATGKVPVTPEVKDKPVQLVKVPEAGVPRTGVTNVGLVANTSEPVPVSSVTAVRKLALVGVAKKAATPVPRPDTPVDTGKPVQLVKVPEAGVPRLGVKKVGDTR